jgi:hypothetical protein
MPKKVIDVLFGAGRGGVGLEGIEVSAFGMLLSHFA